MYTRARRKAQEIIEGHRPEPLDPDVAAQMRALVEAADAELGVSAPAPANA